MSPKEEDDIEAFIDSLISEDKSKRELKDISRRINELAENVIKTSERIEKSINSLTARLDALETDFEQIIEAMAKIKPQASSTPKPSTPVGAPSGAPSVGAPVVPAPGATPAIPTPVGAPSGAPSVGAPSISAPNLTAPSVGAPSGAPSVGAPSISAPNLTAPSVGAPSVGAPSGASAAPAPAPTGPGGISKDSIQNALAGLKKVEPVEQRPRPKPTLSPQAAMQMEIKEVLQRRKKRSAKSSDKKPKEKKKPTGTFERPALKSVPKDEVVRPDEPEEDEYEEEEAQNITASDMKSLLEKRLKSAFKTE